MPNSSLAPEKLAGTSPSTIEPGTVCTTYQRSSRILIVAYIVILIVGIITSVHAYNHFAKDVFTHPDFDENAVQGFPDIKDPKRFGFSALEIDKGYTVHLCGVPANDGQNLELYITNPKENDVWLRVEILDDKGKVLGSSGVLKQGEYLPSVKLDKPLTQRENPITVRIVAYEPDVWTSRGNVTLNITAYLNFR